MSAAVDNPAKQRNAVCLARKLRKDVANFGVNLDACERCVLGGSKLSWSPDTLGLPTSIGILSNGLTRIFDMLRPPIFPQPPDSPFVR